MSENDPAQLAACYFVATLAESVDGGTRETQRRVAREVRNRFFDANAAMNAQKSPPSVRGGGPMVKSRDIAES